MKKYLLYSLVCVLAACKSGDEKAKEAELPQGPLTKSANSEVFNRSFGLLLTHYYDLKDNFITEQDSAIAKAARGLVAAADSLKIGELKGDTMIIATAKTYALGISAEAKGLLGEKTLDGKRKSFQMISEQLYDLVRTVRYDRAVIYHDYCPMAFNDQGAHWLSNTRDIRNPYIPKQMINCGEVKDSIDFK
ncbi:DUF3347 domain-containing protein [Sediminibacterium roseum]|uniref:DUF3347 domain-containing protein n=1 Tax=Sediminibacterium roseum TaxID=1978412 RepID=A0ABW9ZSB8_9BACT|nr:DUF3347 domain-containing protein [Sediminibacterium roseum]NCI49990.1 DUF3347 domain-containing protein [Sediminibacterium roseum]